MNLTDDQKQQVATWLEQGLKLSDVQKQLESAFGLRMTYMEVRFLIDDLKLTPKDPAPEATPDLSAAKSSGAPPPASPTAPSGNPSDLVTEALQGTQSTPGNVSVSLDHVTRAGAVASGQVTFSDGQSAQWYLDQMGRLGMTPSQQGYRPSEADVQQFQLALESELQKMGM